MSVRGVLGSCVVQVSRAALLGGYQNLSVLVGPEAIEVNEYAADRVALTAVHQILQRDLIRVSGLHHVEDLVLRTHTHSSDINPDWGGTV